MKHTAILLNHGYTPLTKIDVEIPIKEFDQSITDPTFFTPVGSLIRKLNSQDRIAMSRDPNLYDFPDGKDNGMEVPLHRRKGVDLAELSEENNRLRQDVVESLSKDATRRKKEQLEKASGSRKQSGNNDGVQATESQA